MAHAYAAGAAGMPSAFFRGYVGSDLAAHQSADQVDRVPFTGEMLAAVPALHPDVAVIHAQRADREGNVLISGIIGVQKEAVLAARNSVVTVEEVVDDLGLDRHECDGAAVVDDRRRRVVPGGAVVYAHGYYGRDNAFYTAWDESRATAQVSAVGWTSVIRRPEDRRRRRHGHEHTASEMMTVAAARALGSEDICFVGIGLPSAACNLARLTHAPKLNSCTSPARSRRGRRCCRSRSGTANCATRR